MRSSLALSVILLFSCLFCSLFACQSNKRVVIVVDGERRVVETMAPTVAEVLRQEGITLGDNDRLDPPGYTPIDRTATIQIVRVTMQTTTAREPVEFTRRFTRDEALPEGQLRMMQLGTNGQAEVTSQITYEDGKEVSRREISRRTLQEPTPEILAVGTQNSLPPVALGSGALAYIANGNAWIMRQSTQFRRPLTAEGDLDGRVFDLSPDGSYLLFTRAEPDHLNSLWLVDTVPFDAKPRRVPLDDLLYAQWAGSGSGLIAYSTGEKTPGAPGWKAHNDLFLAALSGVTETVQLTDTDITTRTVTLTPTPAPTIVISGTAIAPTPSRRVITRTIYITSTHATSFTLSGKAPITYTTRQVSGPNALSPYSWWGGSFAWSPDAQVFAYASANEVGLGNTSDGSRFPMREFPYYNTRGSWVWLPQLAWSPDSRFVAATIHGSPTGAGLPEDATTFDIWVFARDNSLQVPIARDTGMWSSPTWSPPDAHGDSKIAFGIAQNLADSERARYSLWIMDSDGSNREQIFPGKEEDSSGLQVIQVAWSPDASQLLAIRSGDLWLYDLASKNWSQLTANGESKLPRWR